MRPRLRFVFAFAAFVAALVLSRSAKADPLTFELVDNPEGVTIAVRGFTETVSPPKSVVTSKTGLLLFFDGHSAKAKRLRPASKKRRLAYAQVGRSGKRVALRLAQRSRASGRLSLNVVHEVVAGGVDIRITDSAEVFVQPQPSPRPAVSDDSVRAATIAALESSLKADAETIRSPAPVTPAAQAPPPAPPPPPPSPTYLRRAPPRRQHAATCPRSPRPQTTVRSDRRCEPCW